MILHERTFGGDRRRSANLTVANGLFDFLYHKRDRRDLPEDVTDAVCCMVVIQGQCWQIGSPEKHLRETHCKGETIEQSWVAWSPSQLQVPAPVGSLQSQGQLLSFLSSLVNVRSLRCVDRHVCGHFHVLELGRSLCSWGSLPSLLGPSPKYLHASNVRSLQCVGHLHGTFQRGQ